MSSNDLLESDDHRKKVLDKLVKLQKAAEGEAKIGNTAAAEAFAAMINKMLLEYELNPSEVEYARASEDDPVVEVTVDRKEHGIRPSRTRISWQEDLAAVVARSHMCSYLVVPGTNIIIFVGTKAHATVAAYVYGVLVPAADKMSRREYDSYWLREKAAKGHTRDTAGYRGAWLSAFILRILQRLDAARAEVVKKVSTGSGESSSTALMRLNGALVKTENYMKEKYAKKKAPALDSASKFHAQGYRDGKAAADRMPIGRKGVDAGESRKKLGSGQ